MKKLFVFLLALCLAGWAQSRCTMPDNGTGTADFPPECPYDHLTQNMRILDGLPPGSSLELRGPWESFFDVFRTPIPGGERVEFKGQMTWEIEGTGAFEGYHRMLTLSVQNTVDTGPRMPGDPVQTFPCELFKMQGQITGDPDFDLLRLTAGSDSGLSGPGQTTLTQLPGGNYAVDSFFDITYRIDFVGSPGGPLAGMSGSTTGTARKETSTGFSKYFSLRDIDDWARPLAPEHYGDSLIRPLEPMEWSEYLSQINNPSNMEFPEPYPPTNFLPAELYVWECSGGGGGAGGCIEDEAAGGLVMAWGDQSLPQGSYASAWVYEYGEDPDLSNSILKIQVEAPCGMQQISVGLQDAAGNIRGWYWNVAVQGAPGGPGVLPCSPDLAGQPVRNTITIDLSRTGTTAASPASFNYSSAAGFAITQVLQIVFDENINWVAGTVPPPPGQTDPKPWNAWFNLTISPNAAAYKGYYVKYSQPPEEIEEGLINGWDEVSVYDPQIRRPILADDWLCKDRRPVTDLHWWGSFKGWTGSGLPQVIPQQFHIGIWTDVAATPTEPSHPGTMVWEHFCDNWVWNYAGADIDPRCEDPSGQYPCEMDEACFQFNQLLSEPDWFWQDPLDGERVYWISIAAVYAPGIQIQYPWGWKTRPHLYNDDAVRILDTNGTWPPTLGQSVTGFTEVQYPAEISWDLAFELTTNKQARCYKLKADLNHDCIVDLDDLADFATEWLMTE